MSIGPAGFGAACYISREPLFITDRVEGLQELRQHGRAQAVAVALRPRLSSWAVHVHVGRSLALVLCLCLILFLFTFESQRHVSPQRGQLQYALDPPLRFILWLRRFSGAGGFPGDTVRTRGRLVRLLDHFPGPR